MNRRFKQLKKNPRGGGALVSALVLASSLIGLAGLASLGGCMGAERNPNPMPPVTPQQVYTEPEQRYANPGSLFSDSGGDGLFADSRARRVGDIVLVKMVEQTKAKNKADLTSTKTASSDFSVGAFFGSQHAGFLGPTNLGSALTAPVGGPVGALGTSSNSGITTTGETKSENYVTTVLAVRVLNVMPNGLLQLEGAREVKVNAETQYMVVTGMTRASDVAADNSVLSTQVADLRVEYFGKGALSDRMKSGWFTRLMDNFWPF